MAEPAEPAEPVVMLNVFTVAPADQARLLALLAELTARVTRHQPGFLSSTLHASVDGTRVANYARWASRAAFEAMLQDPRVGAELDRAKAAMSFARAEAHLYEVRARLAPDA